MRRQPATEGGFTLVELVVALAIFSFVLLIIVSGFINIVRINNQALASNAAQDNARAGMNELVRAIRDSTGVAGYTAGPNGTICLNKQAGIQSSYEVTAAGVLTRYDLCGASKTNPVDITNNVVKVVQFDPKPETVGVLKPEISITLRVVSNNNTTNGAGPATVCNANNADRPYCAAITLTSGATPR